MSVVILLTNPKSCIIITLRFRRPAVVHYPSPARDAYISIAVLRPCGLACLIRRLHILC
jgi:hypothetical protein